MIVTDISRPLIDYQILSQAINFYSVIGYKQVEVPWSVVHWIDDITRPKNKHEFRIKGTNYNLCGSGEQGFINNISLYECEEKLFTVTPCFRDEKIDILHQSSFLKLELGIKSLNEKSAKYNVQKMISDASYFFESQKCTPIVSELENGSFDIFSPDKLSNLIELGSYGYRKIYNDMFWCYGTGLALPRFSIYRGLIE
jgi:hypothetical protein